MKDYPESKYRKDGNARTSPASDTVANDWTEWNEFEEERTFEDGPENEYELAESLNLWSGHDDDDGPVHSGDEKVQNTLFHTTLPNPSEPPQKESKSTSTVDKLEDDRRYQKMLVMMQYGRWPDVVEVIHELKGDYPNEGLLDSLLNEAQLKSDIVVTWGTQIKGRKLTVRQEQLVRRSIPFILLLSVVFIGLGFYEVYVAPSREVVAMSKENQEIVADAQTLTQNGNYEEALNQYELVLARDPQNASAQQGIQETRELMALVAQFDLAMDLVDEGNIERALTFLNGIQSKSPGFRNVDVEIKRLESMDVVQELFLKAESAYVLKQWLTALPIYEQIRELSRDFETQTIANRLTETYYNAGLQLTTQLPAPGAGPEEALDYLRKGRTVDPEQAQMHLKRLDYYFRGMDALDEGRLEEAINLWQGLYDADPQYLGGYLARRLYAAYLSMGAREEQEQNYANAQNLYMTAAGLAVEDTSNAQNRLAALAASVTPTPMSANEQSQPVYVAPQVVESPATATPEPVPSGWIAFRTNRNGPEEIYLMSEDGTEQKPAPASVAMRYEELTKADTQLPDGTRELRALTADGRTDANIYSVDLNGGGQTMVTNLTGDEYDAVYSPTGDCIAFVSNQTGNDEIWTANPDGSDAYQVTWNEWEWDKRPSFSPDGSKIVFYSNRSGWRQIWVMDRNGGSQYNLSYNAYDDWDPVWIK